MPCKGRAFYAGRKLTHTGERGEAPEICRAEAAGVAGDESVKRVEEAHGLFPRLPFHGRAHHRGRRLRDRAAVAGEAHFLDRVAVETDEHGVVIAAERVVPVDVPRRVRHLVKVSGILVVVEDDLLIELSQIGHQRKTSMTLCSPATSASASSLVL